MPVIAPIVGAVAGFIGLTGTAAAIFSAVATTAITVGASLLATKLLAPEAKKPPGGVEFDVRLGGDVYREVPFGLVASAGHLIYFNTFPAKNKYLQLVHVLADWQCESLEAVWVDGERTSITAVTTANGADATYEVSGFGAKFKIWWHAGAPGQAVNTRLTGNDNPDGRWATTDTLEGMCYCLVELEWDDELFPGGRPDILFEFKGARLYDPRLDDTAGGTGTHRWADPTTWEWTDNPAVGLYNFQRGFFRDGGRILGMGVPAARLVTDDYVAAMNVCDEALTEGGSSVARYTGALVVSEEHEHRVAIEAFLAAMAGRHAEQAGFHRIVAGAAQSSVATITQDDLVEGRPVVWAAHRGRDQLVNAVYGSFTSPDDGWQPVGYEPIIVSAWEAEDGDERIVRNLDLPAVTSPYQAHRIALLRANEHRYEATGRITVGAKFLAVAALDWITFTNDAGGTRTYRVGRRRRNADLTLELELEEVHADAYGGAVSVTVPTVTGPADFAPVTTVTNFAVAAIDVVGSSGQTRPGLRFTWDAPDDPSIDAVVIEYRVVGDTDAVRVIDDTPEDGVIVAVQGVLASTSYEARATIVTTPRRATTWTSWLPVTSSATYLVQNVLDDAITAAKLNDLAVTAAKLADGAVLEGKIATGAVVAEKIASKTITVEQLAVTSYDNLFENAGFETGSVSPNTVVDGGGIWDAVVGAPRSGSYNARYRTSGQTGTALLYQDREASEGEAYYIEAWARAASTPANRAVVSFRFLDAAGASLSTTAGTITTLTTSYQKLSVTATAPAGTAFVRLNLIVLNDGNSPNILFDDVYVRRRFAGELIVDGAIIADKLAVNSVETDKIILGGVTTTKIATNAVTEVTDALTTAEVTTTDATNWTDAQSISVTIAANEKVILSASAVIRHLPSGGTYDGIEFRFVRDSTAIGASPALGAPSDEAIPAPSKYGLLNWTMVDEPSAATYTYKLQFRVNGGNGTTIGLSERLLLGTRAKR